MVLIETRRLADVVEIRSGEPTHRINANSGDAGVKYQVFTPDTNAEPQFIEAEEGLRVVLPNELIFATIPKKIYRAPVTDRPLVASTNYMVLTPSAKVDPDFLTWWLNESHDAQHQKDLSEQGTSLTRLSMGPLKQFMIKLPSIEDQRKIGKFYRSSLRTQALLTRKMELLKQYTNGVLNQRLESAAKHD